MNERMKVVMEWFALSIHVSCLGKQREHSPIGCTRLLLTRLMWWLPTSVRCPSSVVR